MNNPTYTVLLSGGLDSAAALNWTIEKANGAPVRAVGFSYGQPHRDAEMYAAGLIAKRRGIPFEGLFLIDMKKLDPTAGRNANGVSRAFVPGRNGLFLARAAAHAAASGGDVVLVMGANADDNEGFPDCRPAFFEAAQAFLRASLAGVCGVTVWTPWLHCSKVMVLRWALTRPDALEDIRDSVSCYRGTRCGECDACTLRARAFAEVGIQDGTSMPVFCGGDPAREAALRS